jgi:hypothetical protein
MADEDRSVKAAKPLKWLQSVVVESALWKSGAGPRYADVNPRNSRTFASAGRITSSLSSAIRCS